MAALDTVRPYMESHGGNVELLGFEDGVAKLRLRGQLQVVPGVVLDARAGGAAGAAGGGAGPARDGRGGRGGGGAGRRSRGIPLPVLVNGAPAWHSLEIQRTRAPHRHRRSTGCHSWSRTWRARCSPIATRARAAQRHSAGGRSIGGALACPVLRPQVLPATGGPLDGRRPPPAPARPAAARGRGDQGGAVKPTRRGGGEPPPGADGLRPSRPGAAEAARAAVRARRNAATSARRPCPSDHRHMLNLYERQIVCVCESCWALRSGDPEFRPTGSRTLWLEDFELPEELWAQFRIPIGLAFFMHSTRDQLRRRDVSEPGGRDRERAPLRDLEPARGDEPGPARPRAGRRGADREPDGRPAGVRDRPDRPLLHARRPDQGVVGGHLGRRRAWSGRSRRYFDELRAVAA